MNEQIHLGGIFDFETRKEELEEVNRELEQPGVWDKPEKAQQLGQDRSRLEKIVVTIEDLDTSLGDAEELLEMSIPVTFMPCPASRFA